MTLRATSPASARNAERPSPRTCVGTSRPKLVGDRHEHYFYAGWRLVETTNHVTGVGGSSYGDSAVLSQFVYGTQYVDEPLTRRRRASPAGRSAADPASRAAACQGYDRNTDASSDDDCLDAGGSRAYYYHQDANWRTVALTGEDGQIVERVEYTAYGEPTLFGGPAPGGGDDDSGAAGELGNAMLVSTVGNPLLHQGLFRDRETLTYHNRFRQYDSRSGRFMQRDPLYADVMIAYQYTRSRPNRCRDPLGLQDEVDWKVDAQARRILEEEEDKEEEETGPTKTRTGIIAVDEDHKGGWISWRAKAPGGQRLVRAANARQRELRKKDPELDTKVVHFGSRTLDEVLDDYADDSLDQVDIYDHGSPITGQEANDDPYIHADKLVKKLSNGAEVNLWGCQAGADTSPTGQMCMIVRMAQAEGKSITVCGCSGNVRSNPVSGSASCDGCWTCVGLGGPGGDQCVKANSGSSNGKKGGKK